MQGDIKNNNFALQQAARRDALPVITKCAVSGPNPSLPYVCLMYDVGTIDAAKALRVNRCYWYEAHYLLLALAPFSLHLVSLNCVRRTHLTWYFHLLYLFFSSSCMNILAHRVGSSCAGIHTCLLLPLDLRELRWSVRERDGVAVWLKES